MPIDIPHTIPQTEPLINNQNRESRPWQQLSETVIGNFQTEVTKKYGTEAILNFFDAGGVHMFKIDIDGHQFTFPTARGKIGSTDGEFLVLADGTLHQIDSVRPKPNSGEKDTTIHFISVPDQQGANSYPLIVGVESTDINLNNYVLDGDKEQQGDPMCGGGTRHIGEHIATFNHIYIQPQNSVDIIEKFTQQLRSTFDQANQ